MHMHNTDIPQVIQNCTYHTLDLFAQCIKTATSGHVKSKIQRQSDCKPKQCQLSSATAEFLNNLTNAQQMQQGNSSAEQGHK